MFKLDRDQENYLFVLDKQVFRNVYGRFRMGFSEIIIHKYRYIPGGHNKM